MTTQEAPATPIAADDVTALLREHVGPDAVCLDLRRGAVGNGQETWFVDAQRGSEPLRLVLRRSAPAGVLDDTDRALEHATLACLAGTGLPVPAIWWADDSGGSLARPYFVMDRLEGRPPARLEAEARQRVARQLGGLLARLHRVDADRAPAAMTRPAGSRAATLDEVRRWDDRYYQRRPGELPIVGALLAWLLANVPVDDPPPVLLWGDPGPHNVLVDERGITALLDWELAHLGHPLEDLGNAVWSCLGTYDPEDVIAGYEEEAGTTVDRSTLAYYATFGCVTRSVMQLAGVEALIRGATRALNLGGLGLSLLVANLERAARYAGWGVAGPPAPPPPAVPDPARLRPDGPEIDEAVAGFLAHDVIPLVDDAVARRGLRTAVALLRTAATRARHEAAVAAARHREVDELLRRLEASGVDVTGGLEATARQLELDASLAEWRPAMRQLLVTDLIERAALLDHLAELYGEQVAVVHPPA